MSSQKINGMAFEWAMGCALSKQTGALIIENDYSKTAKNAFESGITDSRRTSFVKAAEVSVKHILEKEEISFSEKFDGHVSFNTDAAGQEGDVRDVILKAGNRSIGISCKSNHEALKHSRLSGVLDFVSKWGLDENGCSQAYWDSIRPLFNELRAISDESAGSALWADLEHKAERFYWPLLDAWADEITRLCSISDEKSASVCKEMISYLIGRNDFYKVICHGAHTVNLHAYNFNGTLATRKTKYPSTINTINKKNGGVYSKTIVFNHGYSINFRIHNASSRVEPSLKFDITAMGLPVNEVYQQTFEFKKPSKRNRA
jgi:hypothetical protein